MAKAATPQHLQALIGGVFDDKKFSNKFGYLAGRWADEREFEDIADYGVVLQPLLPQGVELVGMTKRPFGLSVKLTEFPDARYHIYCMASGVAGWKRTA